ncbi:MAG: methyltransferase [Proteobacteria bacterium]|nr:methyltransferase [Pseudomonadota bacterium]
MCWSVSCSKGEDKSQAQDTSETQAKMVAKDDKDDQAAQKEQAAKQKADEEAKKKAERIKRIAEFRKKTEAKSAEESKRWTDDMHKKAAALVKTSYKNTKSALKAILASPHRRPGLPDRDKYRHPTETLTFLGITPGSTVLEVGAGSGWYTEILAPLLAKKGKLLVTGYATEGPEDSFRPVYGVRLRTFLGNSPDLFGKVEVVEVAPPETLALGAANSVDVALAFREMHNWHRRGYLPQYVAEIFKVVKPGGVLGVVQHRAKPGADPKKSAEQGYLPEDWLIKQIEAAGFKLAEKSEINANPKDTKDYPEGVWTLPPALNLKDKDRAKYEAIGESDRMTLKFVKPNA